MEQRRRGECGKQSPQQRSSRLTSQILLCVLLGLAVSLLPSAGVRAHTGHNCDQFHSVDGKAGSLARLRALMTTRVPNVSGETPYGVTAWIMRRRLNAEHLEDRYNFIQTGIWAGTNGDTSGAQWVEFGLRDAYDDTNDKNSHYKHWYLRRKVKTSSGAIDDNSWEKYSPPIPAPGTPIRYYLARNPQTSPSSTVGFAAKVRIGENGTDQLVWVLPGNRPPVVDLDVGLETNHCDGNDGDTAHNKAYNSYTWDWDWLDDEYQRHNLSADSAYDDQPAAHWWWPDGGITDGCFHFDYQSTYCDTTPFNSTVDPNDLADSDSALDAPDIPPALPGTP